MGHLSLESFTASGESSRQLLAFPIHGVLSSHLWGSILESLKGGGGTGGLSKEGKEEGASGHHGQPRARTQQATPYLDSLIKIKQMGVSMHSFGFIYKIRGLL